MFCSISTRGARLEKCRMIGMRLSGLQWEFSLLTDLYRWFIDASRDVAKRRITQRHLAAKIEHTLQAAEGRAESNDLPNGDFIRMHSVAPEVVIKND